MRFVSDEGMINSTRTLKRTKQKEFYAITIYRTNVIAATTKRRMLECAIGLDRNSRKFGEFSVIIIVNTSGDSVVGNRLFR